MKLRGFWTAGLLGIALATTSLTPAVAQTLLAVPRTRGRVRCSEPCLDAAAASEKLERGAGQLLVVTRSHKATFVHVVVQDPRARQSLLGVEGVKHEDPARTGYARIVEQVESKVLHRWQQRLSSL